MNVEPSVGQAPRLHRVHPTIQPTVLEQHVRLSESMLWKLQRGFFEQEGPRAWSLGTVPHYITSNPFIAGAYARVVLGWLRDCLKAAPLAIDPEEPLYIVEVGAGSGRFAHHFLKRLFALLRGVGLADVRFTYVLTDFADGNVDALASHPWLRPFVASGHLDFARFDAEHDREIALRCSGKVLSPGTVANPVAVIANYVFDGIPQDVFRIEDGRLFESLVMLVSSQPEPRHDHPALLSRLELAYTQRLLPGEAYRDPDLERTLQRYRARLPDTHVLFPCAALRCLRSLRDLSGGRLLVLSADKGYHGAASLEGRPPPGIAVHGSFSMSVDYEAIGQWFADQDGLALFTSRRKSSLDLAAFVLGKLQGGFVETRLSFDEAIERCGPDDFFAMKKATEKHYEAMTLEQILAWVRIAGWDANIFLGALPAILAALPDADEDVACELYRTVMLVWDTYYPIGEERDLALHLGNLLYEMGRCAEALEFHQRSLELYGPTAHTLYGMGLCHDRLDQLPDALQRIEEALLLDPGLAGASAARHHVWAHIKAKGR